jgi:hypothetical protein
VSVVRLLGARHGKATLSDGSGGRKGGLAFRVDGKDMVAPWTGIPEDERPAFIAKAIRGIEARYGIDGWYWNQHSDPSSEPVSESGVGAKKRQLWSMCIASPSESWHRNYQCSRPIIEEDASACALHAAAGRRRAETRRAWKERSDAARERNRIAQIKTADLRELWGQVCVEFGIEPERQGDPRVTESGAAVVDVEILEMFLRRLTDPYATP